LTASSRPPRPGVFSSCTTLFSSAATWRAVLSVASDDRKYVSTPSTPSRGWRWRGWRRTDRRAPCWRSSCGRAAAQVVGVAREQHLHVELVLDQARHAPGDVEHEILFCRRPARSRPGRAAVPGVEHDHAQRRHRVATFGRGAISAGRRKSRTSRGGSASADALTSPRSPRDDAQDRVGARALEPRLLDDPSPISSVRASAVRPNRRMRASLPPLVSTRAVSAQPLQPIARRAGSAHPPVRPDGGRPHRGDRRRIHRAGAARARGPRRDPARRLRGERGEVKASALADPPRLVSTSCVRRDGPSPERRDAVTPLRVIVLDAGHGGHDPGAIGPAACRKRISCSTSPGAWRA